MMDHITILLSQIQNVFGDKVIHDNRSPILEFTLPHGAGTFGLFAPVWNFWLQVPFLVFLQMGIQCTIALMVYKLIVQRRNTMGAYFFGWGVLAPFALYLPFGLMEFLDTRNRIVNFCMPTCMIVIFFRTIEAMYGTSPSMTEQSLQNYIAYYSSAQPFVWDAKTQTRKKSTLTDVLCKAGEVGLSFLATSLLLSFLISFQYKPFDSDVALDRMDVSWELLSPAHIGNSYFHALLAFGTLSTLFELACLSEEARGVATHKLFNAPYLQSRTPSEFWTKRWNRAFQSVLKTGVFEPARKYMSTKVAIFFTFFVSGIYHDYAWAIVFYNQRHLLEAKDGCDTCYFPRFGRVTAFFCYAGLVVLLERPIASLPLCRWMAPRLPTPVLAHFMLFLHLPVAHWFLGDWILGDFFQHLSMALFHIRKMP